MTEPAEFLLTTCQVGAERALKAEFARRWPELRPAYARPGFVTFKAPLGELQGTEYANSIFARASALSLGKVTNPVSAEAPADAAKVAADMAGELWRLFGDRPATGLHIWHRDAHAPGDHGYEPGLLPDDVAIARAIRDARPETTLETWVHPGQFVLDCVVVEPGEWWVGYHQATAPHTCWPGGFSGVKLPPHAVSRAYLKMEEAIRWSQFPLQAGQRCAEIGSAPGGAAQALLDRGLHVIGIDPAEMHPDVLAHPNFTHLRKRGADVRRREFRKVRWLFSDMNVAPETMLETVEGIVTHGEADVRGLILTLKLLDWEMAERIPEYLFRIRTWGYKELHARQLQHNRQEICVAAARGH
jgi:23S rRNA (cytidine2498-2'-O)-methyltransferase